MINQRNVFVLNPSTPFAIFELTKDEYCTISMVGGIGNKILLKRIKVTSFAKIAFKVVQFRYISAEIG